MSKKNTIIVINGRKYDAKTGELLSPAKARPARKAAPHAAAHKPARASTLMRKAVRKPSVAASTRRVKAQTPLDGKIARASFAIQAKSGVNSVEGSRLRRAKAIPRSQLISHFTSVSAAIFSPQQPTATVFTTKPKITTPAATHTVKSATPAAPSHATKAKPQTTAELLEYALRRATSHEQPLVQQKRTSIFRRRRKSSATGLKAT